MANTPIRLGVFFDTQNLYTKKQFERFYFSLADSKEKTLNELALSKDPNAPVFWSQLREAVKNIPECNAAHGDLITLEGMKDPSSYFFYKTKRRIDNGSGETNTFDDFIMVPAVDTNSAGYAEVPPDFADAPANYFNGETLFQMRWVVPTRAFPGSEVFMILSKTQPNKDHSNELFAYNFDNKKWNFSRASIDLEGAEWRMADFNARYEKRLAALKKMNQSIISKLFKSLNITDAVSAKITEQLFSQYVETNYRISCKPVKKAAAAPKRKQPEPEPELQEESEEEPEDDEGDDYGDDSDAFDEEEDDFGEDEDEGTDDFKPKPRKAKPKTRSKAKPKKASKAKPKGKPRAVKKRKST